MEQDNPFDVVQTNLERKLTNVLNGTCYCKVCKNLENWNHRQNGIKRTLKKIVFMFMELGVSLNMAFPKALQECLQAFFELQDLCDAEAK